MQTTDFDYHLPSERIAQERIHPYDHAKLLVLDRTSGNMIDTQFLHILDYLTPNDVLVFNKTKVFKARLTGKKATGGVIEVLLLTPYQPGKQSYPCITKGKIKQNERIQFSHDLMGTITEIKEDGERIITFSDQDANLEHKLHDAAVFPLPHYIHSTTKAQKEYQTVYANDADERSIAAPTAGFHFTEELLEKIKQKGVTIEYITLDVGLGTFQPVKTDTIESHVMHFEQYNIPLDVFERLNQYKKDKKRIIVVGTTSVRTLEDSSNKQGILEKMNNNTNIFIYPPYTFKFVDAMITNFHLPKSTLLMLVAAFTGRDTILQAYAHAIEQEYRFYSFGDAMFIS